MLQVQAKAPSSLNTFFSDLGFQLITVSIQSLHKDKHIVRPTGKWFSPQNHIRAIPFNVYFTEEFQAELQKNNSSGLDIYFTINEGDGIPYPTDNSPTNLNCGKRKNISYLNTLAIDTDTVNIKDLIQELHRINLKPQYVIQSSTNKYHMYFLIEKVKAEGDTILYWEALQKYLHNLLPNMDQSMADTNQVLRVPGFYNTKYDKPFRVHLEEKRDIPRYSLKDLFDRLGASKYYDLNKKILLNGAASNGHVNGTNGSGASSNGTQSYTKFEYPTEPLQPGSRRPTIIRYIAHLMENKLSISAPDEDYFIFVDHFIKKFCTDPQSYLEGGKIRPNLTQFLHDERKRRLSLQFERDTYLKSVQLKQAEDLQNKTLPDDFYLTFPGDLGMIVREIHTYAPNLSLELCFSGSLMISGALKAEAFRFQGAWPLVNGLIIAGTGAGKSTLKDIVERTLSVAGLRGKYPQVFGFQNSVQSLHTSLYSAGGVGTVIVDESGDYLEAITAKNAPLYAKALKKYFKESTTGKDKGTWLHPGGSLSYKVPSIDGGMLSLWMLIQPNKFEGSMSLEDMADGFLPRFFVFNGKTTINLTRFINKESGTETFKPSNDLDVYLNSLSLLTPQVLVNRITESVDKEIKESMPKAKAEFIEAMKRDAIYSARSEARAMNKIEVGISEDAHRMMSNYLKEREVQALQCFNSGGESAPALAVYVRMEEMLMRLLCNAVGYDSKGKKAYIESDIAEACIKFHRFQTDRFITNEVSEMGKGEGEKDLEVVLKGFFKAFTDKGKEPVKIGEIVSAIKATRRPKNINLVIQELVNRGQLFKVQLKSKKSSIQAVPHYIPGDNDDIG